jgi:outer membrane lipoprotein-sorting protein
MLSAAKTGLRKILPCFLFLLGGCVSATLPSSQAIVRDLSSSAVLKKFMKEDRTGEAFKAIARMEIGVGKRRYPLKAALMLKFPSFMRIETIPIIGPPDFLLSLNQDQLKVLLPGKNEFYQGRPSRDIFALFLPLSLPPEDIVPVLMGLPPPRLTDQNLRFQEITDDDEYHIDVLSPQGGKIMTLRMDRGNGHLTGMEAFAAYGVIIYQASYSEYYQDGKTELPGKITIISPDTDSMISVRYSDTELSRDVDESSFELAIPSGMKAITLDGAGGVPPDGDH